MTAAIATSPLAGLFAGAAPPATNASPSTGGSGPPGTGPTFADAVAAVTHAADAAPAASSASHAPPGDPPAASTNPATPADLLSLIAGLLARLKHNIEADGGTAGDGETKDDTPLPDRPAGAGVEQTDVGAMEALMGQLLLVRANIEPPPGSGDTKTGVAALASNAGSAVSRATDGMTQLLGALAQALDGPAGHAATAVPDGSPGGTATATLLKQIEAAVTATQDRSDADAAKSAAAPSPSVDVSTLVVSPSLTTVAATTEASQAALAVQPVTTARDASGVQRASTMVEATVSPTNAGLAATARPAEASAETRDRSKGTRTAEATQATASAATSNAAVAAAPTVQQPLTTQVAAATAPAAAKTGPVTVQIANTVQSAVLRGEHEVRLVLNPPELGHVEIRITSSDAGVSVQMHTEQSGAHDLIQQQLPLLHQALESRDVRVDRLQVSHAGQSDASQSSLDSRGFANQQQQQQRDDMPEWSPMASFGQPAQPATSERETARPRVAVGPTSTGGLDVMA